MNNHLLIVDDMDINRDVLRTMFEDDYQILEASSGEEAIPLAQAYEDKLALVLLDIRMPGISGLDILGMKHRGELLKNVPVIIITASDDPKTQLEAFSLGALDYVTKPFVREVVEYRVANAALRTAYRELNLAAREKERALEQAQQASQAKSRFLTRISHELRTPMNAIIGLTKLLQDKPEDAPSLLDKLSLSANHLLGLLNEMMDISEIEGGQVTLHPTKVCIKPFLASLDGQFAPLAEGAGITFQSHLQPGLEESCFTLDEHKLREALLALLDNAVKFTPPGGRIDCSAALLTPEGEPPRLRFQVRDTGPGIAPDFLPHMFDEFETGDTGNTTRYGGVGLGLSICKRTVTLMDGTVSVHSRLGEGSCFVVELPAHQTQAETPPPQPARQDYDFAGRTLLLADDNEINRMIAVRLLERRHARVETVDDGRKAVERFARSPEGFFDAVLMDIRMPVLDGLGAARQIRALPRGDAQRVPILAMTANAYAEDVKKSLDAGMNSHLSKPIEPDTFYHTLAEQMHLT